MAKRPAIRKAATGTSGQNNGDCPKLTATSKAYATARNGIKTALDVSMGVSEIYTRIGAMKTLPPDRQASIMLNAIGKQLNLQSLLVRLGTKASPKGFFLKG